MKQTELAAALGIDPALVSRLKRQGMPTDSIEAARAWRSRNVAPYARCPAPPPTPPSRIAAPLAASADADAIEATVRASVLLPRELLPLLIEAVDVSVQYRLQAGLDAAPLRPLLCELLHHQPDDERRLSMDAWRVAAGPGLTSLLNPTE